VSVAKLSQWSYNMQNCDEMVASFYSTVTSLDYYLPGYHYRQTTTIDKPWVTDQFRRLIQCRQYVLRSGDMARYKQLRNHIQQLTRQLRRRRKYYEKKMNGLRISSPRNWWRAVRQITGHKQRSTEPLVGLAQRLHDGDVHALADHINRLAELNLA